MSKPKKEKDHILYVDDEEDNLTVFKFTFMEFYKIHLATSAEEGMEILKNHEIKLIISDQRMPNITGVEFLANTAKLYPEIIRIILTGFSDVEAIINAINQGRVYRYVTKPWNKDEFKVTIDNALESYRLNKENRTLVKDLTQANDKLERYNANLEQIVEERTAEVRRKNEELERHRHHLEQMVNERTIDLKRAKEKAEEANRLKSAFLANMSHEIRTPMNAIAGFAYLLATQEVSAESKRNYVNHINRNIESLLQLIDDILDISKIEANQIEIKKQKTKVSRLLQELAASFNELKTQKDKARLEFVVDIPPQMEDNLLVTDSIRLRQVLTNLLSNSLKYTKEGSITFGFRPVGAMLEFFVKDTGIGIARDQLPHIFTRFRKAERSNKELFRGVGLGLAISKSLVEMLGGTISADSTEGVGSTFWFTHPLDLAEDPSHDELLEKKALDISSFDWSKRHVLVAEDEKTNFDFLMELLKNTRARLTWVQNGEQAVATAKADSSIDLVLMDIKMPILDGYQATKHIKALKPQLPIIAQTAYAMADEKDLILEAGCDSYLSKPINPEELFTTLSYYFG